jgi:hypothetical protein
MCKSEIYQFKFDIFTIFSRICKIICAAGDQTADHGCGGFTRSREKTDDWCAEHNVAEHIVNVIKSQHYLMWLVKTEQCEK